MVPRRGEVVGEVVVGEGGGRSRARAKVKNFGSLTARKSKIENLRN